MSDVFGQQYLTLIFVHDGAQVLIGNEQLGIGILHHEVQALCGVRRVKRLIGATGLQHTHRGDDHPLRTRYEDGDRILLSQSF